jgi:large subunit ribosomal protein L47
MMTMFRREFHHSAQQLARAQQRKLVIRPPIAPTVSNFTVSDDHPLWQFFHDQKYLRTYTELDQAGRPWSIPELRRKSFEDLHSLWYSCLKERNVLAREIQVLHADTDQPDQRFLSASDSVRETMWRIRHVLSERHHAQEIAKEKLSEHRDELLSEFEAFYLDAAKDEETEIQEALARLQFSLFGISEVIEENKVDKHFIEGLKYIANLKLRRYTPENTDDVLPITDAGEAFIVFHAEHNATSVKESIDAILKLRAEGVSVDKYSAIETIEEYLRRMLNE